LDKLRTTIAKAMQDDEKIEQTVKKRGRPKKEASPVKEAGVVKKAPARKKTVTNG
jgi:hypothetical protein